MTIFGEGGGQLLADELDVPLLGKVPLAEELREHADEGRPLVLEHPDHPASQAIRAAARGIIAATPQELPVMQAESPAAPAPRADRRHRAAGRPGPGLSLDPRLEINRSWWDERVPIHVASDFYDVGRFRDGGSTLRPFELEEVGDVNGKRLVHLQCHFGLDTLSWARCGASAVGLDFSAPAVAAANELAAETGLDARFVAADVHDAVEALGGERFDVVYTGLGALNWLPDLSPWARVVAALLADGGFLYLSEFHPLTWIYADDELEIESDYFHAPEGVDFDDGQGSYADLDASTEHDATLEWAHTLADVVGAVLGAGLRLELLSEHDYTLFPRFSHLIEDRETLGAGVVYRQPEGRPRLPLMYSLRARRDDASTATR